MGAWGRGTLSEMKARVGEDLEIKGSAEDRSPDEAEALLDPLGLEGRRPGRT